jgi:hypothetical protein
MGKQMMVVALAAALTGCAAIGDVFPTADYAASICAEGVVVVPCRDLGTIPVPEGGQSILALTVALAGPYLAQQAQLKDCVIETYPAAVGAGTIRVVATAACVLQGVPVTETVTLTLAPVA